MATTSKKTTRTPRRTGKAAPRKVNRSNVIPAPPFKTKTDHVIDMLRRKDGASIAEIMDVLGWKEHSVRALLTATIAKGRNIPLVRGRAPGDVTRYYVPPIRAATD
jgi:hypothetical protein